MHVTMTIQTEADYNATISLDHDNATGVILNITEYDGKPVETKEDGGYKLSVKELEMLAKMAAIVESFRETPE